MKGKIIDLFTWSRKKRPGRGEAYDEAVMSQSDYAKLKKQNPGAADPSRNKQKP